MDDRLIDLTARRLYVIATVLVPEAIARDMYVIFDRASNIAFKLEEKPRPEVEKR